jgi:hypothetical protein
MSADVLKAIVLWTRELNREATMKATLTHADDPVDETEDQLVHEWRTEQLRRLGLPRVLAELFAERVDWHAVAALVDRGCSPELALEIAR